MRAQVTRIVILSQHGGVAYDTRGPGSHYCKHANRCHRSNFTYYVADFAAGTLTQKCWDSECVATHGAAHWAPNRPLPPALVRPRLFTPYPDDPTLEPLMAFADGSLPDSGPVPALPCPGDPV